MIDKALHYWHTRKSNFAKALSHKKPHKLQKNGKKIAWSYYRLGMYATASRLHIDEQNWHDVFAKGISHAACGNYEEAKHYIALMCSNEDHKVQVVKFADALAPFMPQVALDMIESIEVPVRLKGALLLVNGEISEAKKLLDEAIKQNLGREKPELFLYLSNAKPELEPLKKLTLMNKFLFYSGVPTLRLKDTSQSLSPLNMECKKSVDVFDGPLVSVLMTTYKTGKRLETAIESVLNQSYANLELFIVDDNSKDVTNDIIKRYANQDARIKYIGLPENVGTYVAKNIALLQAQGEFVTCHDSDDWSHPYKLEKQIKPLLKNKKLVATVSCWVRLDDEGMYYARPVHPLMRINPSSLLFRRQPVLQGAGIWDCVRTGADSEFLARLRLVFGKKAVKKINKPLSFGSHRSDSLMNASSTGYCEKGMSPQRLAYWEAWSAWHIEELRAKRNPFMSADLLSERLFEVPDTIKVSQEDIEQCLK